ncbi:Glycine zipper 2TM domain-containing protein [Bordetella sputigena]|uniref:glycine zipper 2TM domain-containing protein n=1 Tax=Bordetella sputigena TaxID=1416810 RepID=UPI0039EF1094
MNAPAPLHGMAARRGLHPLVAIASVCVIALCAVATAAILGWLPTPKAQQEAAREQSAGTVPGPEDANLAPLPGGQATPGPSQAAAAAPSTTAPRAAAAQPATTSSQRAAQAPATQPPSSQQQAAAACPQCGVVVSVNTVQVPVQNKDEPIVGTVAGGVVGGVVGNQFGGGHGRTALTVLGAVGGALAGREIERNIKQQQTVTRYQLVARTNDGHTHTFHSATPFQYSPGQAIRVENNQLLPG